MDFLRQRLLPILLVLFYQVLPWDLLPDFLGPLGRLDDVVLFGLLLWYLWSGKGLGDLLGSHHARGRGEPRDSRTKESAPQEGETQATQDPYEILGVPPEASMGEVHRAYRREMAKYHPDRVSHLGEELQKLAHKKSLEIQQAYQEILASCGRGVKRPG